jgi:cobalt-zinc-cadmium efflux system outer membrane protein
MARFSHTTTGRVLGSMVQNRHVLLFALLALGIPHSSQGQERFALEDLLEIGRERNPTVQALRAEHAAALAGRRDSGRWENPELEYEWGTGDPRDGGAARSLSGFSASQTFENPLTRHYRLGALNLRSEAVGEDVRTGILEVEFEIRMHYFRILFLHEMVDLARLNEEALSEIRTLIEARADVGEVRELEAIRLRVEHMRARNELEAVELELDQFRRHLNTFLGNVLPAEFEIEGSLEVGRPEPDLDELVSSVLPSHPALAKVRMEGEAAEKSLRRNQLGWLPDPVLSGSSKTELDGEVRTVGVGLRVPLWNQSRAATEEARQRVRVAEHTEEAVRLELEAELLIHHNHLKLYRQTLRLFEDGLLEEAEEGMEVAEASYRQGEISFMEYLDARRTYHSIQIQRHQALFDWNVEWATLVRAVGGGIR